jgi:flagellar biosynthetic protein FlhB
MAHDEAGDRTEQPTARRREEAREEGQIARSADLTAAVALLAGLLLIKALGTDMTGTMLGLTQDLGRPPGLAASDLLPWMKKVVLATADMILPFLALLLVITVAGTAAQSGLLLTWKRLAPKPDRISPVSGFKRLFSADAFSRLALGLLKVAVVAGIAYQTLSGRLGTVLSVGGLHARGVLGLSADLVYDLALRLGAALLLLGLVDYFIQRWRLERQLRMTKQEVRDELKRMEGDPLVKQRRRRIQARLALQRIHAEVPRADVVVTNPTHFAVALRYDAAAMTAPRVVAKGRDLLAERIRQLAQQHRVPIVPRPPLARALYWTVEVGQEIPAKFYRAVAEILAYVYRLSGRKAG